MGKKVVIITSKEDVKIKTGTTDKRAAKMVATLLSLASHQKVEVEDENANAKTTAGTGQNG